MDMVEMTLAVINMTNASNFLGDTWNTVSWKVRCKRYTTRCEKKGGGWREVTKKERKGSGIERARERGGGGGGGG